MAIQPQQLALSVGIGALVIWRISTRIKRLVARQRLSLRRQWISAVVFTLLPAALLPGIVVSHAALWPLPAGLVVGAILALVGLRLTTFESTDSGHYHQPNAWLGVAVSALFLTRLGYRLIENGGFGGPASGQPAHLDPLTLALLGLLSAFFAVQAIGLLLWYYRHARHQRGG